jgi:dihydrofolate synthase/folylpolyglutamate synthase
VENVRGVTSLTYFEIGTLAALWVFAERRVEAAILEVGLGGRLDAVNVIDPDCAIVVSVDIDHVSYLGDNRESIGFEKAGIYRRGRAAIYADRDPPKSLVEHARAIEADLQVLGEDFDYESDAQQWTFKGRKGAKRALPIPALRGAWQLRNASAALAALDELSERFPLSIGEIKRGLTLVRLPGRMQVLPGRPAIALDVAHNPQAARSLSEGLLDMGFFENTFAVFAALSDKDIGGVIDAMRGRIDRWFVAAAASGRAASPAVIAKLLEERGLGSVTRTFATVDSALDAARREAGPNDRIVVFGSFYTVAEAMRSAR